MIPGPKIPTFLMWLPPAPDRARIDQLFHVQRATDSRGMPIHDACALLACFFAAWPTTFVEWAGLPVLVCFLIRMTGHRHVPGPLLWDPVARLALALAAWTFMSYAWTLGSGRDYVNDIATLRFAVLIPAMYPALERRRRLIMAMLVGFVVGQIFQAVDIYGHIIKEPWMTWKRAPGRYTGWWDPAVGGSVLCACLGLHAGALATARKWWIAVFATLGVLVTLACIVATGTRGAWIGAGATLGIAAMVAALRIRPRWGGVLAGLCIVAIGAGGIYVGWRLADTGRLGEGLRDRVTIAEAEIRRAINQHDYGSDNGMRVAMARWALRAASSHPVLGVGAGGYRAFADREIARRATPRPELDTAQPTLEGDSVPAIPETRDADGLPRPHAHAHNWFLHTFATLGSVGVLLTLALVGTAVLAGLNTPGWSIRRPWAMGRNAPAGYDAGPALALVGLACVGVFDAIAINQQTSYLLWMLIALCVPSRPRGLVDSDDGVDQAAAA